MIIIYNLSGFLFGALGLAVGFCLAAATGRISLGLAAASVVWFLSRQWRSRTPDGQVVRPYPSVFFIPLWVWALPLLLLAVPAFLAERKALNTPPDPRAVLLKDDEAALRLANASGDKQLSGQIRDVLTAVAVDEAKMDEASVYSAVTERGVLVLVQFPSLRKFKDTARVQLLDVVTRLVQSRPDLKDKPLYVGVKGRVAYGAIRTPAGGTKTGAVVGAGPLLDYYGPRPTTLPATQETAGQTVDVGE